MITSIAPSEAPAETPSVNGVASGLRSSAWNTTPATASAAPTSAPATTRGRRATKRICASTLSWKGIERSKRASEADRAWCRRAARARTPATASAPNPEHRDRRGARAAAAPAPWRLPSRRPRRGVMRASVRRSGARASRRPPSGGRACSWNSTSTSTPYSSRTCAAVSTFAVGPCASTRPPRISTSVSHIDAARFRSCVAITIVTRARGAAAAAARRRRAGRRGRATRSARRAAGRRRPAPARSRSRRAASRRRSAPRTDGRPGARCRWPRAPLARSRDRAGPSNSNVPEMRVTAHQHHVEHRVVERRMRLLGHDGDAPRQRAPAVGRRRRGRRAPRVRWPGRSTPDNSRSSVVLPQPFGPSSPVNEPAGNRRR